MQSCNCLFSRARGIRWPRFASNPAHPWFSNSRQTCILRLLPTTQPHALHLNNHIHNRNLSKRPRFAITPSPYPLLMAAPCTKTRTARSGVRVKVRRHPKRVAPSAPFPRTHFHPDMAAHYFFLTSYSVAQLLLQCGYFRHPQCAYFAK